eukprot:comp20544_c0_seq1/m.26361 comp20544_c0_seq1/g.26361  ORF comp20544_c0_seq1/g.26361 comp20544_c0_seq1/m.26361 type:complete len:319 (-) comp20544_c0_seq1:207-1163(-)
MINVRTTDMEGYKVLKQLEGCAVGTTIHVAVNEVSGEKVVLKSVRLSQRAQNEVDILSSVHHPHIIETLNVLKSGTSVCLVQPYAEDGDLYDYVLKRGPMKSARQFKQLVCQIASAVSYLHNEAEVAHRDLKLENFVVKRKNPTDTQMLELCLIDFGDAARLDDNGRVHGPAGTDGYMAPEAAALGVGFVRRNGEIDGRAADMFALGVVFFMMLTCQIPFETCIPFRDASYREFVERHAEGHVGAVFNGELEKYGLTKQFGRLMDRLLHPDPTQRVCAHELLARLDEPWFVSELDAKSLSRQASAAAKNMQQMITVVA